MSTVDFAALAREREARRPATAAAASAPPPLPRSWSSRPATASGLLSAHRTIRLARMVGLAATFLAVLLLVLGCGWRIVICFALGGVGFARAGASFLHGMLPPMLIEVRC